MMKLAAIAAGSIAIGSAFAAYRYSNELQIERQRRQARALAIFLCLIGASMLGHVILKAIWV